MNLEHQKERFKNHIATLTDYGNVKILDFKNPESNEYRLRFLFEEDYYRLHISGDLGSLIATNYCNMTYEKFSDYINNSGYFFEKVDCCSRATHIYDEDLAKKELLEYLKENDIYENIILNNNNELETDEEIIEDFLEEVFSDFEEDTGLGHYGQCKLSEYITDIYDLYNIGMTSTKILDLYLLAFKLAKEQLENNN